MGRNFNRRFKLLVVTEKPDETARWLSPLKESFDVVVSASADGAWQLLHGDRIRAVVLHLIAPRTHAPRVVSTLKGRPELRDRPLYVIMPDGQAHHPTLGATEGIQLLEERRAAADLPMYLLRDVHQSSGTRPAMSRVSTGRLDQALRRVLHKRSAPYGGVQKVSSKTQSNSGNVNADRDVDPTTRLATSSGERW